MLRELGWPHPLRILGTDVVRSRLAAAQRARYTRWGTRRVRRTHRAMVRPARNLLRSRWDHSRIGRVPIAQPGARRLRNCRERRGRIRSRALPQRDDLLRSADGRTDRGEAASLARTRRLASPRRLRSAARASRAMRGSGHAGRNRLPPRRSRRREYGAPLTGTAA